MRTQEAIMLFGSGRKLAKALGITSKAVYQWGNEVPRLRAPQIREEYAIRVNRDMKNLLKLISNHENGEVGRI